MIVHGFLEVTDKPIDKDRNIFCGSHEQIAEDVRGCAKIGAQEIFLNPTFGYKGQSLDRWLYLLEQLSGLRDASVACAS